MNGFPSFIGSRGLSRSRGKDSASCGAATGSRFGSVWAHSPSYNQSEYVCLGESIRKAKDVHVVDVRESVPGSVLDVRTSKMGCA